MLLGCRSNKQQGPPTPLPHFFAYFAALLGPRLQPCLITTAVCPAAPTQQTFALLDIFVLFLAWVVVSRKIDWFGPPPLE